jgi:hypothetical protein
MFARQTHQHLLSLALALVVTAGMLGSVGTRASHPAQDSEWMAQVPASATSLQCPVQG